MKRLSVQNFGPIREANVEFGDLTVLVGPQASGKSLFVQLAKAVDDAGAISSDLESYGYEWGKSASAVTEYCWLYFGAGLGGVVNQGTKLHVDGKPRAFREIARPYGTAKLETVFLVPAQRVLALQDGWPKPFMAYSEGDPYALRRFSEVVRQSTDTRFGSSAGDKVFPRAGRLREEVQRLLDKSIYQGATIKLEVDGSRKRIVLSPAATGASVPYGVWSAGQREFTPLLLGLYWLLPPGVTRRAGLETVIIEEPEMGLHPQAIVAFGMLVLELLHRNYSVVLSTHSPVILDLVWALRELNQVPASRRVRALANVFGVSVSTKSTRDLLRAGLAADCRTYYFAPDEDGVRVKDISTLDPGSDDTNVAGWGGLSGFSGRIAETVGLAMTTGEALMAPRKAPSLFGDAVERAEHLVLKAGLDAVKRGEGRGQIEAADDQALLGSVAIDDDCRRVYPNSTRWDYVIGTKRAAGHFAYFVEVHSAETSEVSKLEDKLTWLLSFLAREAQASLRALPRAIHWVASGRVNIPKTTPQYRKLKTTLLKKGLVGPDRTLRLV